MGRVNVLEFFIMGRGDNYIFINRERIIIYGIFLFFEEIKAVFKKKMV